MICEEAYQRLEKSEKRKQLLMGIKQPMTASQLSKQIGISRDQCSLLLGHLVLCDFVRCLNPYAMRSRLYWLTPAGIFCQKKLNNNLPAKLKDFPDIDWELYGWVCFSHRAAIIRALTEPMQPATIKRRARQNDSKVKMSANNVRDVIRLFKEKGIVTPVRLRKKAHLRYELTEQGKQLRELLVLA